MEDIEMVDVIFNRLSENGLPIEDVKELVVKELSKRCKFKTKGPNKRSQPQAPCPGMGGDIKKPLLISEETSVTTESNMNNLLTECYNSSVIPEEALIYNANVHFGPDELKLLQPKYYDYKMKKGKKPKRENGVISYWLAGLALLSGLGMFCYVHFRHLPLARIV